MPYIEELLKANGKWPSSYKWVFIMGVYSIEINSLKSFVNILSFLQTKAEASLERV